MQSTAFFLITDDSKVLACLLHQLGQSDNSGAATCLIGRTAGEQKRWHIPVTNLIQPQSVCPEPRSALG